MNDCIRALLMGSLSGIGGTALGGVFGSLINSKSKKLVAFVMEFSAGLMTGVVCFELIPEGFDKINLKTGFLSIVFGVILTYFLQILTERKGKNKNSMKSTGLLIFFAIAVHNFPEGLAIGSGFQASFKLGISILLVILIHDVPEGMAMSITSKAGGTGSIKSILMTVIAGIPTGIGAFFGCYFSGLSKEMIGVCLLSAAGSMLYVVFGEIIPQSKRIYSGLAPVFFNITGFLCGLFISMGS